jgi:UDP-N-acetylglucosamine--dolichyl-phosphate N-acetylglucosaminephosphotransferase
VYCYQRHSVRRKTWPSCNRCTSLLPLLSPSLHRCFVSATLSQLVYSRTSGVNFRYPSKVFVGDTYTYFAGMTFAVVGILGHFSKTVLLFFIPQIFNSAYSVPQIFGIIPCPRHRLPRYPSYSLLSNSRLNLKTGKLEPSFTEFKKPIHPLLSRILRLLAHFHLLRIYTYSDPPPTTIPALSTQLSEDTLVEGDPDEIIACSNLTIINLALVIFGPMREDYLCLTLLIIQGICGVLGFVIRHRLAFLIYDRDS